MRTKNMGQTSFSSGHSQTQTNTLLRAPFKLTLFLMLSAFMIQAQQTVYVPYSGDNTVTCGTNVTLQDHNGNNDYWSYAYGYTVLDAGPGAVIMINGTYDTESGYDYVSFYDGPGTGGTLLGSYSGLGTINFTSTPGQIITVEFYSDWYVEYSGFDFSVTYTGSCFSFPCSGAPAANTVVASSTLICPGTALDLDLATQLNLGGQTIQWKYSMQSALGPYTNMGAPVTIIGPGSTALNIPNVTGSYFYSANLMCASGGTTVLTPIEVDVEPITLSTVPYYEDFEGITGNDDLPNCSWSISDITKCETANQTFGYPRMPNSGSSYAYFNGSSGGGSTEYYYTNGIQLNAGVTYSAAVWYQVPGYSSWGNFSIMYGQSQSPGGLVNIASIANPNSSNYTVLTNTFMVPTSGIYYIAIKAKDNFNYDYLAWDDLSITAPCNIGANSPTIAVTGPSVICAGTQITLNASGPGTYTWTHNGLNSTSIVETPTATQVYTVTTSNPNLPECTASAFIGVTVNQLPILSTFFTGALTNTICQGNPITLFATGALTYTWSQGTILGPVNTVTPSTSTTYTVVGSDVFGCVGRAIQPVIVAPLPNVTVQGTQTGFMCVGEQATLTANGAATYSWAANIALVGNPIIVSPPQSTQYTVTGTDANGCSNRASYIVAITDCVGLSHLSGASGEIKVYPNPTNGDFNIESHSGLTKAIEIRDVTGRVVLTQLSISDKTTVKMSGLAAGVYYVKVQTEESADVIRLIKE